MLAATWEGIRAAEELEQSGINCNPTLLFFRSGPRAEAPHLPLWGRIYDWYQKHQPQSAYQVWTATRVFRARIYQYYNPMAMTRCGRVRLPN